MQSVSVKSCGRERRFSSPEHMKMMASKRKRYNFNSGYRKSPTNKAWLGMQERCRDSPANEKRHRYCERGIVVCERWLVYANFLEDMGECPSGMTLDRIDNDKGYEPGNCRWATMKQQQRNRRNNRILTIDGKSACLAEWAELSGNSSQTIGARLRSGWTEHDAVWLSTKKG